MRRWEPALLVLALSACDKSMPTEPRSTEPTPTPQVSQLAGEWTGTVAGCGSISASVTQHGSSVAITFTSSCPQSGLSFRGTLSGDTLTGTVARNLPLCAAVSGSASGNATVSHIRLMTDRVPGTTPTPYWPCPGIPASTIDLTR